MEGELSIPRNVPPLPDHVRGADRVSAAIPKREGRPGKGRSFDLGAQRQADEELSRDGSAREERAHPAAPAERDGHAAEEPPAEPADDQAPSAPAPADGKDNCLDYQA